MKAPILSASVAIVAVFTLHAAAPNFWGMPVLELKKRAQNGEADAELGLARAYELGKGVEENPQEALRWYEKAAAQGSGVAMRDIGRLYEKGKGVPADVDEAVRWYKKAIGTRQQSSAESELLRLSKAGLTPEKYAGVAVEGGPVLSVLDTTTPLEQLVRDLADHTEEIETGKAYWIGYNPQMFSIAARGEPAIPLLVNLAKAHADDKVRRAAATTLHLIGIESTVAGRFMETFKNRKAREALWELLGVEGMTDDVAQLLKRDPWPADLPAYFRAFQKVPGDCPLALNALDRYPIPDRPLDSLRGFGNTKNEIKFVLPKKYSVADYARLALESIAKAFPGKVTVEERVFEDLKVQNAGLRGGRSSTTVSSKLDALLTDQLKDLAPAFDYCTAGNAIFYYGEYPGGEKDSPKLVFCSANTAKLRWLDWWDREGEKRYCYRLGK